MSRKCVICKLGVGKYKCPICLAYYCSVPCCNAHRDTNCETVDKKGVAENKALDKYDFPTGDTVPVKKLKMLSCDKELKEILSNPHLRHLLKSIDGFKNPEEIMQKAMLEPIFVEFADVCLGIVAPPCDK